MRKFFPAMLLAIGLAGCASTDSGLLVSRDAEALGGNLFVETEASGPSLVSEPGQDGLGTLRILDAVRAFTNARPR